MSSPTATRRPCFMACCTSPATTCRIAARAVPPVGFASPPATRSTAKPPASKSPPARSARVLPWRRHGHRREASRRGLQPSRLQRRRPLHLRPLRRRRPDGRHLARGRFAGRNAGPGQADRASTTTTSSRSTDPPSSPTPKTSPSAFEAYHWHVQLVDDGNDLEAISKAIKAAKAVKDQAFAHPRAHGHRLRQPQGRHQQSAWRGARAEATKATKKNLGWPEDKSFYVPEEAKQNWLQAVDKGQEVRAGVERPFRSLQEGRIPSWQRSSSAHRQASWPTGGRRVCPSSPRMPSRSPRATPAARS